MKDCQKPCQHTLTDDAVYKEVVVIGNGPSGMVTSFMLAGNVPYLKEVPADLPIDDMLRARLENIPAGQSLYEADLTELAQGLEGRSQNPIPLLMDNLLRPCADLGIQADSLIEWKYDVEKQIDHIVLGRGPPGGAWHTFSPSVLTLSPAAWLSLPPHAAEGEGRLPARAVANYCRRYVHKCKLQRYFRSGVIVSSVRPAPRPPAPPCARAACPRTAAYVVQGYDKSCGRPFRILCKRVVVACGGGDRPNTLAADVAPYALHSLSALQRALPQVVYTNDPPSALVVGSGVSAADAVWLLQRRGLDVKHVHRDPAAALKRLSPQAYPDYTQVYKMMCDGPSGNHPHYTPYPHHVIADVTPRAPTASPKMADADDDCLKSVKLLNVHTNQMTEITVSVIAVLIGSKPDLFFLQTNFNLNDIDVKDCLKCTDESKHAAKRKIEDRCFLKNHWHYFKSVLGQSIQSCKSRYLKAEINGNDTKCIVPDCDTRIKECKCEIIPYSDPLENKIKCQCQPTNPYSSGVGFGVDPKVGVDCRGNPVAIDKGTHEMLYAPKGMYALGPLTADNFVRFIPGGALATVAHMHKERKNE